jgi:hypothetical protein
MSIEKRRFIRFSLDIPAFRYKSNGEVLRTVIRQVSVAGCLAEWDDTIFTGDLFRIEIELQNKNRLPLLCKALYKFPGKGIGAKFIDVSRFEQQLLGQIISQILEDDGLPLLVDPFAIPPTYVAQTPEEEELFAKRRREEEIAGEIMESEIWDL